MITPEVAARILDNARNIELQAHRTSANVVETGNTEEGYISIPNPKQESVPKIRDFLGRGKRILIESDASLSSRKIVGAIEPNPTEVPWTRDEVALKLNSLKGAVKMELRANGAGVILTGASAGVTAGAGVGAWIFSNPVGLVTTVLAGGSGTTGVIATTKDSIKSWFSLRSDLMRKLNRCQTDLNTCPQGNQAELDKVVDEIKAVYDYIDQKSTCEQPQKK